MLLTLTNKVGATPLAMLTVTAQCTYHKLISAWFAQVTSITVVATQCAIREFVA